MAEQFANDAWSTLADAITDSDLVLSVRDASTFPTVPQFRLRIQNEILLVTALAGATFTVSRGQEGTIATSHPISTLVQHILTAGVLSDIVAAEGHGIPAGGTAAYVLTKASGADYDVDWEASAGGGGGGGTTLNPFSTATRRFRGVVGDKLVGASGTPHIGTNFSCSFWLKLFAGGIQGIWSRWTDSGTARELFVYINGTNHIQVDIPYILAVFTSAHLLGTGIWYHIAITRTGNDWVLYLDGVSDATQSNAATSEAGPAPIIGQGNAGIEPLAGSLHDICFWDVGLTAAEVLSLTNGTDPATVQAAHLTYRLPITGKDSPEIETVAANNATVYGTTPGSYF